MPLLALLLLVGCPGPACDTGSSWMAPPLEPIVTPCPVASLAFASAARGGVACAGDSGVAFTENGGVTWAFEPLSQGLLPQAVAVTPHGEFRACARGPGSRGVILARRKGAWAEVARLPLAGPCTALGAGDGGRLLVRLSRTSWAESEDGGRSWRTGPGTPVHVVDIDPGAGWGGFLLLNAGRQFLHLPGLVRSPPPLPEDFEARALAVGGLEALLVGGEQEGAEGDPRAVLAFEGGSGWIRPRVPPGIGTVEDVAAGPEALAFVAVGRATLASDGGYALVTRNPTAGVALRVAPVPLVEVVPAGRRYLARGSDGSVWRGDFLQP
ncbi:MAG: hypothetical protein JXB39_11940 [Deltaproteobacteria bacterium]|nr:hypothetical protein [Deltaproteobacteria bacterium]